MATLTQTSTLDLVSQATNAMLLSQDDDITSLSPTATSVAVVGSDPDSVTPDENKPNAPGTKKADRKNSTRLNQITTTSPKAASNSSDVSKNVMAAVIKMVEMLLELEVILIQASNADQQNQAKMGDDTTYITHNVSVKQEAKIKEAEEEYEKAQKLAGIMKIVGIVVAVVGCCFAACCGLGALIVAVTLTLLTQPILDGGTESVMDKLCGNLPTGAKFAIVLGVGLAAGGVAGLADGAVAAATAAEDAASVGAQAGANVARVEAEEAAEQAPSVLDKMKASFKFSGLMAGSQMLMVLHPIQDLLMDTLGKKDKEAAEIISAIITVVVALVCCYYAGSAASSTMTEGSTNLATMMKGLGFLEAAGNITAAILGFIQGQNYKAMSDTETEKSKIEPLLSLMKELNEFIQALMSETTSTLNAQLKNFDTDFQNIETINNPMEASARVLAHGAA